MSKSKIGWCDCTINPVVGCSKCSPACDNCYAERQAARLVHMPQTAAKYAGVVDGQGKWTGKINGLDVPCGKRTLHQGEVDLSCFDKLPKKPQRIFVGSMTDLFHENVSDADLGAIFARIEREARHIFMVLTKRPERMREYMSCRDAFPMNNLWLGVTVCNQAEADEKIPILLQTPAAKRFVSIEPMLGAVDISHWIPQVGRVCHDGGVCHHGCQSSCHRLEMGYTLSNPTPYVDWAICGGETGPKARPMHPDWVRSLRDQCSAVGMPFYFKGWGEWDCIYDRDIDDPDYRNCPKAIDKNERYFNIAGGHGFNGKRVMFMRRTGKRRAGRLLDGIEYSEVPPCPNS